MLVNVLFASCMSVGGCSAVKASSVPCVNLSQSEISSPRWSSVYECQSVECAFTSPVIIELGMLVMYCMQFVMSVSVVSMVSRVVSRCFLVLCICWLW